jgi:hypothetical protein
VKKLELHMDALITIIIVFVLVIFFLIFQRYQYSQLTQENVDLQWENSQLEVNLALQTAQLDRCRSFVDSLEESDASGSEAVSRN